MVNRRSWRDGGAAVNIAQSRRLRYEPARHGGEHRLGAKRLAAIAAIVGLAGCAESQPAALRGSIDVMPRVGDVVPVHLMVRNEGGTASDVKRADITGVTSAGYRVTPLSPSQAALCAGGAGELDAAMRKESGVLGMVGAEVGESAVAAAEFGVTGPLSVVAGPMVAAPALIKLSSGPSNIMATLISAKARIKQQSLIDLAMPANSSGDGYVYLPAGRKYSALEVAGIGPIAWPDAKNGGQAPPGEDTTAPGTSPCIAAGDPAQTAEVSVTARMNGPSAALSLSN